jgi:hypothetical protein
MNFYRVSGLLSIAAFAALSGTALADTAPAASSQAGAAPMGTLVYDFTYSASQNVTARDSSNPAENWSGSNPTGASPSNDATNLAHYGGSLNDKGTMTVNILRKQADGALVVMISEQGEQIRRASPAECVVYGNTNVICDPNKTVYNEEYTLLRFLAQNFVDPSELDADKHWQIVQDVNNDHVTADYSINSNDNGQMQIGEKRTIKETGVGHLETDVQTKIGYDFTRTVPTSVDEYAQQFSDAGIAGTQRTIYQTTLQLQSDTMAKQ